MNAAARTGSFCLLACALLLTVSAPRAAQDAGAAPEKPAAKQDEKSGKRPDQAALDESFKKTLTGATLVGRWRTVEGGKLGEEADEKYTIHSVTRTGPDLWILVARIQYGGKDVNIPVPVNVLWAGDTPIISITDAGLPGLGTYTARVMVYRDVYTGAWFGTGHGGILSGSIVREKEGEEKKEKKEESGTGAGTGGRPGKSE
jgi:hypothetical protein